MGFEIVPVPADKALTWSVKVDGKEISPRLVEISSDYGDFALGWRPEGYHGWAFKPGKGGAMTLPYCKHPSTDDVLVGLIHEYRPNMGPGKMWSAPSGFIDFGESAKQAALRESSEEAGLDASKARALPGVPINTDRMYYIMQDGDTWGMQMHTTEVDFKDLEPCGKNLWKPRPGLLSHKKESDLYFVWWKQAIRECGDAITLACISRLLAEIS